jgi:hypothetical protein
MIHTDDNDNKYYLSLDEAKEDGLFPVKATSLICFFRLRGRTSVVTRANLEPIPDLRYVVYAKAEEKYYLKEYRGYDLETLFFYRPTLTFSGEDVAVEHLRQYIKDGTVSLLMTKEQVADTSAMLERIWNARFTDKGKMPYRSYLDVAETLISFHDYLDYGKGLTGTKTVQKQFNDKIEKIWSDAYKSKK